MCRPEPLAPGFEPATVIPRESVSSGFGDRVDGPGPYSGAVGSGGTDASAPGGGGTIEAIVPRRADVGGTFVDRYLPTRRRTTVGAWCFLDAYGPDDIDGVAGMSVGPHPHSGLQTVTWLFQGDVVHRDSLGTRQAIRPGQLNLMTAGAGIAHAEESPTPHPRWLHGVQLWVALPDDERWRSPAFEHHPVLPTADVGGASATVIVGELAGARSPATNYSPLVGAEVTVTPGPASSLPLDRDHEHAVLAVAGGVVVDGRAIAAGDCAYLERGRTRLSLATDGDGGDATARLLLLGGEPFAEPLVMWWNFVGRSAEEIADARAAWESGGRFGGVEGATADRVPAPPLAPERLVLRSPTGG